MDQESLCQQHLAAAQHAAPATVCGPGGTLHRRELPPVREPDPGHESQTKALHLVWEGETQQENPHTSFTQTAKPVCDNSLIWEQSVQIFMTRLFPVAYVHMDNS